MPNTKYLNQWKCEPGFCVIGLFKSRHDVLTYKFNLLIQYQISIWFHLVWNYHDLGNTSQMSYVITMQPCCPIFRYLYPTQRSRNQNIWFRVVYMHPHIGTGVTVALLGTCSGHTKFRDFLPRNWAREIGNWWLFSRRGEHVSKNY